VSEHEPHPQDSGHGSTWAFPPLRKGDPQRLGPQPVELDSLAPEVSAPPPGDRRRGPRFSLLTSTLVLAVIALLGSFFVVNIVLMPSFTRQGAEAPVPEVTGLSELQAERVLVGEGLKMSKSSEQWSPDVPRGFVMTQDPPAGSAVKLGRRITVVVSLGAQGTSVPAVAGESARQAQIVIEAAGLRVGRVGHAYSDEVGRDLVLATDPPGETLVDQETVVNLLISLGAPPRSYVLPDLRGQDAAGIARSLQDQGFQVLLREGGPRGGKDGLVTDQEPGAGHRVATRDSIVLFYHP
jgi:eukaryotic-like serine/threonine-protein kinase